FRHIGRIFVTHGEKESSHGFAELLQKELKVPVVVPKLDESFEFRGSDAVSTWDSQYERFSVTDDFAGAIQVAVGQEMRFRGAYGMANRRFGIKNNLYTAFNLGSMREFFAQVALARLLVQGKLVRELVGEFSAEPIWEERLEELTGQAPWNVVSQEVLIPGEMGQSAYYFLDQLPASAASGYTTTKSGQMVENIYAILGESLTPQLFSTAPDLTRLWKLLAQGEFLPREIVDALLAPYWDGLQQIYKIEGRAPGAQVVFGGNLHTPLVVTVLSNGEHGVLAAYEQLVRINQG
ncbi:MAG: hypothetical protein GX971_07620, partial [Firmicutes bacterium]|nr:hypothetical protein [Bacillota bacterium]